MARPNENQIGTQEIAPVAWKTAPQFCSCPDEPHRVYDQSLTCLSCGSSVAVPDELPQLPMVDRGIDRAALLIRRCGPMADRWVAGRLNAGGRPAMWIVGGFLAILVGLILITGYCALRSVS